MDWRYHQALLATDRELTHKQLDAEGLDLFSIGTKPAEAETTGNRLQHHPSLLQHRRLAFCPITIE